MKRQDETSPQFGHKSTRFSDNPEKIARQVKPRVKGSFELFPKFANLKNPTRMQVKSERLG